MELGVTVKFVAPEQATACIIPWPNSTGPEIAGRIAKGFPYPGAKPAFKITPAKMNDFEWLSELIEVTAEELPAPKPKKKKSTY